MKQYRRTLHSIDHQAPDCAYAMAILDLVNEKLDTIHIDLEQLEMRHWNKFYQEKQSKVVTVDKHLNIYSDEQYDQDIVVEEANRVSTVLQPKEYRDQILKN